MKQYCIQIKTVEELETCIDVMKNKSIIVVTNILILQMLYVQKNTIFLIIKNNALVDLTNDFSAHHTNIDINKFPIITFNEFKML